MSFARRLLALLSLGSSVVACSPPNPSTDVQDTGTDATRDGTADAVIPPCLDDRTCDDHVFCNGVERCTSTGCMPASPATPCGAGETCNEMTARCESSCADSDHDGHRDAACGGDDCDDTDGNRFPGNPERCDTLGHDDDCDPATLGPDADHDMFQPVECCNTQRDGSLRCGGDCDDMRATVNPTAAESCNGLDDDCSGVIDDHGVLVTFYRDLDSDGYGNTAMTMSGCSAPLGYVLTMGDCNDASATVHPGAGDACGDGVDNDCNGAIDDGVHVDCYLDADRDGLAASGAALMSVCGDSLGHCPSGFTNTSPSAASTTDCNDTQASVHPGAIENCNMIDDDCDGVVDDMAGVPQWADGDGDGHGAGAMALACVLMTGYVTTSDDCDDTNPSVHPGAPEACDGVDNNCDGAGDLDNPAAREWCLGLPHVSVTGASVGAWAHCTMYNSRDPDTGIWIPEWGCRSGTNAIETYTCASGWAECDPGGTDLSGLEYVQGANGCETDVSSDANCGACGHRCNAPSHCCAGAGGSYSCC